MFSVSSNILLKFIYLKALVLVNNNNTGLLYQCRKKQHTVWIKMQIHFLFLTPGCYREERTLNSICMFSNSHYNFCVRYVVLSNNSKCMSTETGELFSGVFLSKQSVCESHQVNLCIAMVLGMWPKAQTLLVGQLYSQILIKKNLNTRLCQLKCIRIDKK